MPEAYIYDHVRTPRGKGKADGSLHEVTALALATAPLKAIKERNNLKADTVDDVVFSVLIIPHTLNVTTLGGWRAGTEVNLEVDLMARYAARLSEMK